MSAPSIQDSTAILEACRSVVGGAEETLEQSRAELARRETVRDEALADLKAAENAFDTDGGRSLDLAEKANAVRRRYDGCELLVTKARERHAQADQSLRVAREAKAHAERDVTIAELTHATSLELLRAKIGPHATRWLAAFDVLLAETAALEASYRESASASAKLCALGVNTPAPCVLHTIVDVLLVLCDRGLSLSTGNGALAPLRGQLANRLQAGPNVHLEAGAVVSMLTGAMQQSKSAPPYAAAETRTLVECVRTTRTFAEALAKAAQHQAANAPPPKPYIAPARNASINGEGAKPSTTPSEFTRELQQAARDFPGSSPWPTGKAAARAGEYDGDGNPLGWGQRR